VAKGKPKVQKSAAPKGGRSAKAQVPATGQWRDEKPIFCFKYADRGSSEPWKFKPESGDATTVLDFLCDMARSTWREIEAMKSGGRYKHHYQSTGSFTKKAREDVERHKLPMTFGDDDMFRFRLGSERRLWGYRRGKTFHVVWWDPDHLVYPTEPN
jgi:hypothetical protein